ncbi:MAG: type II toxin-antitoxin system prevent-host-death family antitoxin [Verrucomicrobiota bacterium]
MRTATVSDLRNHYTSLLGWISAGEQIVITQRGKPVARLIPANPAQPGATRRNPAKPIGRRHLKSPATAVARGS